MTPEYAIIVAGGRGTRMNTSLPKQFIMLNGLPVLAHTINAFKQYSEQIDIILVLPRDEIENWGRICKNINYRSDVRIVAGGETRFQSVKKGLGCISGYNGLVAIHDGVRPLVPPDIIGASFRIAAVHGTAVSAVRLKESLRITDQDTTQAVDRSKFRIIQTPQTFDVSLIKKAYQQNEITSLTDDASVAEQDGNKISLFEGSYENIKITTPGDIAIAEALINQRKKADSN